MLQTQQSLGVVQEVEIVEAATEQSGAISVSLLNTLHLFNSDTCYNTDAGFAFTHTCLSAKITRLCTVFCCLLYSNVDA